MPIGLQTIGRMYLELYPYFLRVPGAYRPLPLIRFLSQRRDATRTTNTTRRAERKYGILSDVYAWRLIAGGASPKLICDTAVSGVISGL